MLYVKAFKCIILCISFTCVTLSDQIIKKLNNPVDVSYSFDGKYFAITNVANGQIVLTDAMFTQRPGQVNVYRTSDCGLQNICKPLGIFQLLQPIQTVFSANNKCIAVASFGEILGLPGNVSLFKLDPCALTYYFTFPNVTRPTSIAFSPDGAYFAIADTLLRGKVLLYKVANCTILNPSDPSVIDCFGVESLRIVFSPDSKALAVSDISNNKVKIYSIANGSFCKKHLVIKDICRPHAIEFSLDGHCLAVSEFIHDGRVITYSFVNGIVEKISEINHLDKPSSLAFNKDGTLLAVGQYGNGKVDVYTVARCIVDNDQKKIIPSHCFGVSSVAFSPKKNCLAIAQEIENSVSIFSL